MYVARNASSVGYDLIFPAGNRKGRMRLAVLTLAMHMISLRSGGRFIYFITLIFRFAIDPNGITYL